MMKEGFASTDVLGGGNTTRKQKVSYYFDEEFCCFNVSTELVMKPLRIKMTDTLIKSYEMDKMLKTLKVDQDFVSNVDLTMFHADDYVDCLKNLSVAKRGLFTDQIARFSFVDDCPIFDHMYDYCQRYTAGSLLASQQLA
jgi:histone deacetylase 1/2